jgi:hypothetical protein
MEMPALALNKSPTKEEAQDYANSQQSFVCVET